MSSIDITALNGLLSGAEPELTFVRPGEESQKPYRFKDDADRAAAQDEALAILGRVALEDGCDEENDVLSDDAQERFHQIISGNERLRAAVLSWFVDQVIESDPKLKKHFAGQAHAAKGASVRADDEASFLEDPHGHRSGEVRFITEEEDRNPSGVIR